MKTRSALPSQSSPGFTTAAVLDTRFTTVDIAASLPAFGVAIVMRMSEQYREQDRAELINKSEIADVLSSYFRALDDKDFEPQRYGQLFRQTPR